jgi:hypothetical protein
MELIRSTTHDYLRHIRVGLYKTRRNSEEEKKVNINNSAGNLKSGRGKFQVSTTEFLGYKDKKKNHHKTSWVRKSFMYAFRAMTFYRGKRQTDRQTDTDTHTHTRNLVLWRIPDKETFASYLFAIELCRYVNNPATCLSNSARLGTCHTWPGRR